MESSSPAKKGLKMEIHVTKKKRLIDDQTSFSKQFHDEHLKNIPKSGSQNHSASPLEIRYITRQVKPDETDSSAKKEGDISISPIAQPQPQLPQPPQNHLQPSISPTSHDKFRIKTLPNSHLANSQKPKLSVGMRTSNNNHPQGKLSDRPISKFTNSGQNKDKSTVCRGVFGGGLAAVPRVTPFCVEGGLVGGAGGAGKERSQERAGGKSTLNLVSILECTPSQPTKKRLLHKMMACTPGMPTSVTPNGLGIKMSPSPPKCKYITPARPYHPNKDFTSTADRTNN